jgi:hypothetical protein
MSNNSVRGSAVNGSRNTRPRRQNSNGNNMSGGIGRRRGSPLRSVRSNSEWRNTQNVTSGSTGRTPSNMSNNLRANVERARRNLVRARGYFQSIQQAALQASTALVHSELSGQPRQVQLRLRRRFDSLAQRLRRRIRELRQAGNRHNTLLNRWNNTRGPARRININ